MANDSVRITNMPDSGSPSRVAYDLAVRIWSGEHIGKASNENIRVGMLDLYAECLHAANGYRDVPKKPT